MDKGQETISKLVISCSNAAKLLQLQKEYFNQMPLLIKPPIHIPKIRFITFGRDAEISSVIGNILPQFPFSRRLCQPIHPCQAAVLQLPAFLGRPSHHARFRLTGERESDYWARTDIHTGIHAATRKYCRYGFMAISLVISSSDIAL